MKSFALQHNAFDRNVVSEKLDCKYLLEAHI